MSKGLKFILFTVVLLALAVGVGFGLAKAQIIPTQKMGEKNPALARALTPLGLYKVPAAKPATAAPVISPEQQALNAQRDSLQKERAAWETQKQAQAKAEEQAKAEKTKQAEAAAQPALDPREVARLASIYEQMSADNIVKIFAKMTDPQILALLRRMDEKKVGELLAAIPPERAAFFTLQLSRASAPIRTAANTP